MGKPVFSVDSLKHSLNKKLPPQLVVTADGTTSVGGWHNFALVLRQNGFVNGAYDFDFVGDIPVDHPTNHPTPTGDVSYTFEQIPADLRTISVHGETNSKSISYDKKAVK